MYDYMYIFFNGINNLRNLIIKLKLDKIYFARPFVKLGNLRIKSSNLYYSTFYAEILLFMRDKAGSTFYELWSQLQTTQQYTYIKPLKPACE